jgi:hypothetical protein
MGKYFTEESFLWNFWEPFPFFLERIFSRNSKDSFLGNALFYGEILGSDFKTVSFSFFFYIYSKASVTKKLS